MGAPQCDAAASWFVDPKTRPRRAGAPLWALQAIDAGFCGIDQRRSLGHHYQFVVRAQALGNF